MKNRQTCGQGLAEHSNLPAKMGEVIGALADNLEIHRTALDRSDESSRREDDAYSKLAAACRKIALELEAAARDMAGYRDLTMGRHDPEAMASGRPVRAFEELVRLEGELLAFLENRVETDRAMLAGMAEGAPAP